MPKVKDREKEIVENQLRLAVRNLITAMNEAQDLKIAIVEENTERIEFEFSLEYPPYEGNQGIFKRRVSNLEIEEFIENVMSNMEEIIGCKYIRGERFIFIYDMTNDNRRIDISKYYSYSHGGKLLAYKKIHISMPFVEAKD